MLETLRQRRYLGLFAVTFVVAMVCFLAGTWQIARFHEKRDANRALRDNNGHPVVDIARALGRAAAPTGTGRTDEFRHVTATGTYLTGKESLVRGQTVNSDVGYLVLTPFQTRSGVLLVVRGFVSQTQQAIDTPVVAPPPSGTLSITTRLEPAESKPDRAGKLPANQVESINATDQATRLAMPVWNGYGELLAGQPGTSGLTPIPDPDMSNPAGGAEEPQHAAYVVQWYLFGGLALAMPFVLAGAERRRDADERQQALADNAAGGPGRAASADEPSGSAAQPKAQADKAAATGPAAGHGRLTSRRARRAALDQRLAGKT
ncbi:MAG: hypothetical protein QOK10_157 [Pseudonocardiales bacterium]|nr:hypothetical protein [Pseudonocardiales bacterium]